MSDQATFMAHLRALPRCRDCSAPATEALYTGRNEVVSYHCSRHAEGALRNFKARK